MPPITSNKKNRYPGIRSFEKGDKSLFYGRSREIEELYNLIKIKPVVVLFGKSGLGKTSLLQAGVGPLLEEQLFFPLLIRLQNVSISPSKSVLDALEPFLDSTKLEKLGGKTNNKIWDHLSACTFKTEKGGTAIPVLVFDQFEELFNHPKKVQEEWTTHIGDLIDGRLPEDIEDALNNVPRAQRTTELMEWYRGPEVKVVFAIRSDRVSELHSLRYEIPAILQNRYELKPLHSRQATEAIEKPATLEGADYTTLPFSFAPETIQKIQKELSNELDEIESFQLQIVCQHIEEKVKEQQEKGNKNIVVTPDYLGDKNGIKNILKNYYGTQIASLGTEEEQLSARKLLEEGLIMSKRRIGVAEAVVKETYNIDENLLGKLLASRLIRPEDTRLGRTYEISHDTLVKPILEAYEKRRVKEDRLIAFQEQREQDKELQRRSKIKNLTIVGILLATLTSFAFYQMYTAQKALKDYKNQTRELEFQTQELEFKATELEAAKEILVEKGVNKDTATQQIEARTNEKIK
ncbi:MAG: hypothetical protein ACI81W_004034, partial [Saprospiraceae bacterium]